MGRSVITPYDATAVAYTYMEPDEDFYRERFDADVEDGFIEPDEDFENWMWEDWNNFGAQTDWDDLKEWVAEMAKTLWPSFEDADSDWHRGVNDEQTVLVENAHSEITISEYCGCVAISLAPKYNRAEYFRDDNNLGEHWRKQISEKFEKTFGTMERIGGFSDGTSVYLKVS